MRQIFFGLVSILSGILGMTSAHAQEGGAGAGAGTGGAMGIAAVVNEDIITVFDVQSRLGMFIATSGLENTPDIQRRILPQVIQSLIA